MSRHRPRRAIWLALLALGTAAPPGAQALGGGAAPRPAVQVVQRPGEVQVLRGGRPLHTYPVPRGQEALTLVSGGTLALVTQPQGQWADYRLQLFDLGTGHLLSQQTQVGRVSRLYALGGDVFVEATSSGGAAIADRTLVQPLRGPARGLEIDGWRQAQNAQSVLFNSPNGAYSPYEPVALNFSRYDLSTRHLQALSFAVPTRPGCGPVAKDGTLDERETYTAREVVATRHDACGVFEAHFDWTAPGIRPVVRPLK
ncbi:hypothetical protein [Deinococcus multiflagellatus]|uniref:hypothetical protein n=1 Tax=Deinococcus multiflagellatus TaxID=1656887 RepID=UPI001CCA5564|nr:hypothetical protein [Deinococcus multiflagellatus]MBZ9712417.1 hypothetical protein [Deinococcus multiflagellatus]